MKIDRQVHPYLEIKRPNGEKYVIQLQEFILKGINYIHIGREETNHIVLPDPQKRISRHHCSIQKNKGKWWIVDEGSSNGTFIKKIISQLKIDVRSSTKVQLNDKDDILILGEITKSEQSIFWRLRFIDPGETNQVFSLKNNFVDLEYNLNQEKLFRRTTQGLDEIELIGQEKILIDYMVKKNYHNQNQSVVCSYDELIKAIWQNELHGITRKDIRTLVCKIRKKIELNTQNPKFILTIKGIGYRADIKIIK